jgi:hypothetical protein
MDRLVIVNAVTNTVIDCRMEMANTVPSEAYLSEMYPGLQVLAIESNTANIGDTYDPISTEFLPTPPPPPPTVLDPFTFEEAMTSSEAIAIVEELQTYRVIDNYDPPATSRRISLLTADVEAVLPGAMTLDGPKSSCLVALLVQALKGVLARLDALEN